MSQNASFGIHLNNQKFSYDVQSKLDVLEEFEDFDQMPVNDSSLTIMNLNPVNYPSQIQSQPTPSSMFKTEGLLSRN